jgi:Mesyanzhinovviridae DNA primase
MVEFDGIQFATSTLCCTYKAMSAAEKEQFRRTHPQLIKPAAERMRAAVHSDIVVPDAHPEAGERRRLESDTTSMVRSLHWLRPGESRWLITKLNPVARDGSRKATTLYLKDDDAAERELREANQLAGLNIYFPTGTPNAKWDPSKRNQPRKEADEIGSCALQYFDGDFLDKDGNVIATEESRLADINAAVAAGTIPRPGLIINSGNGVQCFWRLREPLEPEQAEGRNRWLIGILGGDPGVWDRGRLMRVGGGINWPSKRKIDKGCVPVLGRIISIDDDAWATADQFQWVPEEKKETKPQKPPSGATANSEAPRQQEQIDPVTSLDDPRLAFCRPDVKEVIKHGYGKKYPSRSEAAWRVACYLVRSNVSDGVIRSVFANFKIGDTLRDSSRKFDDAVERLLERAHLAADNPDLAEMNECFAAGSVKGKFRVIKWIPDARYPHQRVAEFYTRGDFCNAVVNPKIQVPKFDKDGKPNGTEMIGRGAWWLKQDHRQEFDGIDYRPGQQEEIEVYDRYNGKTLRILNMFAGFSTEPDFEDSENKCALYLAHVRDNIAGRDEGLANYILDWMADGVQHPERICRTSLSMRGVPGCGKGVFAAEYGALFGRHFLHVTNKDHVTGKFNAHSAETNLIFVDEALYAEIKADARLLKTLVSESTKILERKGIDAVEIGNYARLIFATIDQHPLQIEHNDRRYCAIYARDNALWANETDKNEKARRRSNYFKGICDQMNRGGRAALLGYLLKRDISEFNPEAIPETTERNTQKLMSAPAGDKMILEFAMDGALPGAVGAARPWLARAHAKGSEQPGLLDAMRHRGGSSLQRASDVALTDILKEWKFTRHPLGDGTGWAAPPLAELRDAISSKYPAITWDTRVTDWAQCVGEQEFDKQRAPEGKGRDPEIPF